MITGFNTDVSYKGLVYHVQTEDKGPQNPLIETLVYKGGEILASRRLPYGELIKDPKRVLGPDDFFSGVALLKRGKRNICVLVLE